MFLVSSSSHIVQEFILETIAFRTGDSGAGVDIVLRRVIAAEWSTSSCSMLITSSFLTLCADQIFMLVALSSFLAACVCHGNPRAHGGNVDLSICFYPESQRYVGVSVPQCSRGK